MGTLPALVGFKAPEFNLGETFTQMARLSAYDAQRRSSELEQEEKRTKLDRDRLWRATIADAFPTADPRAPGGLTALQGQAQAPPAPQAPPAAGGLAGPQAISQGPSTMGPPGMASQVPTNQWMDVNPQTGEWSTPGGMSAPPIPPLAPSGLTQPAPAMPAPSTVMPALGPNPGAQPQAPGQPPLQGGGMTLAGPQAAPPAPPGAPQATLGAPQPQRPLQASVPGLMPMPDPAAVQRAFTIDPEKTSQWYGAYLTQRGKQLDEVDRNNKLVYQVTGAMLENPEYYKEGLEYLQDQGVPVPKNMPQTFNPALVKFHNDLSRQRLDPLQEAQRENQLALAALNRDKLKTEALTRENMRRFGAGDGGQPAVGAPAGSQAGGSGSPLDTSALPATFRTKAGEVEQRLGMQQGDLLRLMHFETGGTFDPAVKNRAGSGATGLIQFMPDTAKALGTTPEALAKMTPDQQLDYVEKYLSPYKGKIGNLQDAYMAVLYPKAIGQSGQYKLFTKEGEPTAYRQNAGLDTEGKGYVTVSDAVAAVQRTTGAAGEGRAGATATSTNPRIAELRQQIAAKQQQARGASVTPGLEGGATQLRSEISDLQQELRRLEDQAIAERHRQEPSPARLAEQEAGRALAPIDRTMAESISTNKSVYNSIGKMEQVMREGTDLPENFVNLVSQDAPEIQRLLQADPKELTGVLQQYETKWRAASGNDPRINRFLSALANMRDLVIFERSGGSVTGNELTRATGAFFGSLPNVNQAFSLFMQNLANVKETVVDRLGIMGASVRPLSGGKAVYGGLPKEVRERIEAYEKGEEPPKAQASRVPKVVSVTPVP